MLGFEPVLSPHHAGGWEHRQAGAWRSAQHWKVLFPPEGLSPCPSWMPVYKLPPGPNSNHSFKVPHWFSFPESWGSGIHQRRSEEKAQANWVLLGRIQATSMVHGTERRICQGFHSPLVLPPREQRWPAPPSPLLVHLPWLNVSLSCSPSRPEDTPAPVCLP